MFRSRIHFRAPGKAALLIALVLLAFGACTGSNKQPDLNMQPHDGTDEFLRYQEWLNSTRPAPPPGYQYTERNRRRYEQMKSARVAVKARLEHKERVRQQNSVQSRVDNQRGWDAMQSQHQAAMDYNSQMERMIISNMATNTEQSFKRFDRYQDRVDYVNKNKEQADRIRTVNASDERTEMVELLRDIGVPDLGGSAEKEQMKLLDKGVKKAESELNSAPGN